MADDADLAQGHIEAEIERALAAHKPPAHTRQHSHCLDCGEPLEPHRRSWGLCVPCKSDREHRARMMAVGV